MARYSRRVRYVEPGRTSGAVRFFQRIEAAVIGLLCAAAGIALAVSVAAMLCNWASSR